MVAKSKKTRVRVDAGFYWKQAGGYHRPNAKTNSETHPQIDIEIPSHVAVCIAKI